MPTFVFSSTQILATGGRHFWGAAIVACEHEDAQDFAGENFR